MSTPSITLAQVVALVGAIIGLGVAFGLHITKLQQQDIVAVVLVGAPFIVSADAVIRHGRSASVAAAHNLAAAQIQNAPDGVDRAPAA